MCTLQQDLLRIAGEPDTKIGPNPAFAAVRVRKMRLIFLADQQPDAYQKMHSGLLAKKKFLKIGQTSPNSIFWQQERTHTDFLVDKNAFPMARFGCKMARKSKTQNCHLCHFLRIPRSYNHDTFYVVCFRLKIRRILRCTTRL